MSKCERCDETLQQGEVTLCGDCHAVANAPDKQPADMFYDKCPKCAGEGRRRAVIGFDECFLCGGIGFMPAGIRKSQVDAIIRERDELRATLHVEGVGVSSPHQDGNLLAAMYSAIACTTCGGNGVDPMSDNVNSLPCPSCDGTGYRAMNK